MTIDRECKGDSQSQILPQRGDTYGMLLLAHQSS